MLTRKQLDRIKNDLIKCRECLLTMIDTPDKRKTVAEKSGQSLPYITDFYAGRKKLSDRMIVNILDKVVE